MGTDDEARAGGGGAVGFGSGGELGQPCGDAIDHDRPGARQRERSGLRIGMPVSEGVREVVVTLLASLAFGLGWAAVEAGLANSALARDGIPTTRPERAEAAPEGGTGYAPAAMERR